LGCWTMAGISYFWGVINGRPCRGTRKVKKCSFWSPSHEENGGMWGIFPTLFRKQNTLLLEPAADGVGDTASIRYRVVAVYRYRYTQARALEYIV